MKRYVKASSEVDDKIAQIRAELEDEKASYERATVPNWPKVEAFERALEIVDEVVNNYV